MRAGLSSEFVRGTPASHRWWLTQAQAMPHWPVPTALRTRLLFTSPATLPHTLSYDHEESAELLAATANTSAGSRRGICVRLHAILAASASRMGSQVRWPVGCVS